MQRIAPEIKRLEQDAYEIVSMICSEAVPEADMECAIASLRTLAQETFPERPSLFDETYGRRFRRLRTRFRPHPGLLADA